MTKLDEEPRVYELAQSLGIEGRGDWVEKIREFALAKVRKWLSRWPEITSLEGLQRVLCERLSVKIEYVREDHDLDRIAAEHRFSEVGRRDLIRELNDTDTEGYLIRHPNPAPGDREYLAIVDARGEHANRTYFTAWHEIVHLIVTPPRQLAFDGFRRTIHVQGSKDAVESVVDAVTGRLAFYAPFVQPVLKQEVGPANDLTLAVIEKVRARVAPEASFYAAAIAILDLVQTPALFVQVKLAYKKKEQRRLRSRQGEFNLGTPSVKPRLRAVDVVRSGTASDSGLSIYPNMRVPAESVLARAFESVGDETLEATENQAWWVTSGRGPRPPLPLHVQATRRGSYVYGLLMPA